MNNYNSHRFDIFEHTTNQCLSENFFFVWRIHKYQNKTRNKQETKKQQNK